MELDATHGHAAASFAAAPGNGGTSDPNHARAMRALGHVGFVQNAHRQADEPAWRWRSEDPAGDRALLSLLATLDLQLEVGPAADGAAWIALAMRRAAPIGQDQAKENDVFVGSGFQPDAAIRACLGEAAEFHSWLYRAGDGARHCTEEALGGPTFDPWAVLGFASWQRECRDAFNDTWAGYDSMPDEGAFSGEIEWSPVTRLTDGRTHWLPTPVCHGRYPAGAWRNDGNGCAAGRTVEDAVAAALHELVERDATGIWWYGRCSRPAFDDDVMARAALHDPIAVRVGRGEQVHLLDLTHDLGVPVAACVLFDSDGHLLALGFGCKADAGAAARAAYLEMCQMELAITFARQRVERLGAQASAADRRLLGWLATADLRNFPHLAPDARAQPRIVQAAQSTPDLVTRLDAAGLAAFRLDLHRPEIGIPAVRLFVPGLCHYKPRLGHARLVDVPRRLAWRGATFNAADLSTVPLLV